MLVFTESAPEANHARRPSYVRNDDAERVEFTVARERAKQGDLRSALVTPILALRPIQEHGAIAIQVRIGAPLFSTTLFPIYIAPLLWGGLYFRDERVRALIPLRV